MAPLGIYVHVPFCRVHCPYCDFYTYPSGRDREGDYVDALLREIALAPLRIDPIGASVDTVYFGGGTPSLLSGTRVGAIMARLRETFAFSDACEITMELNPEDVNPDGLEAWAAAGVTRFSLGVQSLNAGVLEHLGRVHGPDQVNSALAAVARFPNWSADLIFGWAGQTGDQLHSDLAGILAHRPRHVSLYQLTLEPKTRFGVLAQQGRMSVAEDDRQAALYLAAVDRLEASGLQQYEVSNFARPGFEARHNVAGWRRHSYLGLGPSACSLLWARRTENVRSLPAYMARLNTSRLPVNEVEILSPEQEWTERVWLGLRTRSGIDTSVFDERQHAFLDLLVRDEFGTYRADGAFALRPKGMAVLHEVVARLLLTDQNAKPHGRHLGY